MLWVKIVMLYKLLSMLIGDAQLRDFIVSAGLVSRREISEYQRDAQVSGRTLGDVLVSAGHLSEDDFRRVQSYLLGIPFVDLSSRKIDFETLSLIPEPIARNNNIVAYKKGENALEVALLDMRSLSSVDFLSKKVGLKILPRFTGVESMKSALLRYQRGLKSEFGDIIRRETGILRSQGGVNPIKLADDISVVRVFDTLLKHAIVQNASDIHLEPFERDFVIRYRIHGILHDAMVLPREAEAGLTARVKSLAKLRVGERDLPQDGRFKVEMNGERVSLRVSIIPTAYGEKTVIRLMRESAEGFTLEHLGLRSEALERVHAALKRGSGMILVSGPASSGTSTTLYTMIDILNVPGTSVSTIEDPVEYQISRVSQTQVRPEIGLGYPVAVRAALRQDADVIMIGEMRDIETLSLATHAVLSGRTVLSMVRSGSSVSALSQTVALGVDSFLLASTVSVVVNQRLVRKLADSRNRRALTKSEVLALGRFADADRLLSLLRSEKIIGPRDGWDKVSVGFAKPGSENDGYAGRTGIFEVLSISPSIKDLIARGAKAHEIEERARKEGSMSLAEDGIIAAAQGLTTLEEVFAALSS